MDYYEHVQFPLLLMPPDIIEQCNLQVVTVKDRVHFEVRKGMPDLKKVGDIAHSRLSEHLRKSVCECSRHASSLWYHKSLPVSFTLVADDLGVKHIGKQAALHLI